MYLYYSYYHYVKGGNNKVLEKACRDKLLNAAFSDMHIPHDTEIYKTENGKPYLKNSRYYFNISHSRGLVCVCVSEQENGIDCELIRERKRLFPDRIFNDEEQKLLNVSADFTEKYFSMWTYKECFVKLIGKGLSYPVSQVDSSANSLEYEGKRVSAYRFLLHNSFGSYSVCCMEYADALTPIIKEVK